MNMNANQNSIYENEIKQRYLRWNKIKMFLAKLFTICVIGFSVIGVLNVNYTDSRVEIAIPDIPNVSEVAVPESIAVAVSPYVYDNGHRLSNEAVEHIDKVNNSLYSETGAEIFVVIESNKGNVDAESKSESLFKKYNVSNNGLLLYFSIPNGYSLSAGDDVYDSVAPYVSGIFDKCSESFFNQGDYEAAVTQTFKAFVEFYIEHYGYSGNVNSNYTTIYESASEPARPDRPAYYSPSYSSSYSHISSFAFIWIIIVVFLIIIFAGKRRRYVRPRQVHYYRRPGFWGGFGWGMYNGMRRTNHYNNHRHNHMHINRTPPPPPPPRPNNTWGMGGSGGRKSPPSNFGRGNSGGSFGRGNSNSSFGKGGSSGRGNSGGSFGRGSSGGSFGRKK